MHGKIQFQFSATVWKHKGTPAWFLASLPAEMSADIRSELKWQEEGWGRLKATAQAGNTKWDTAIWFDSKQQTYLLPVRASVRKLEKIEVGQDVRFILWV